MLALDLTWTSDEAIFNYDTDMSSFAAAKAFAKEIWNKQFFQDLEKAHQTHYEQMGIIKGELIFRTDQNVVDQDTILEKEERIHIRMNSFRDHSFGTSKFQ